MAEGKKSFLLYCDLIHTVRKLPKEKQADLFVHILEYVNDLDPKTEDMLLEIAFEPIKQSLKRDLKKYELRVGVNRKNGKKGGRPPKPKKPNGLNKNPKNPNEPKKADSDSDSVNDSVNVNEIEVVDVIVVDSIYPLEILKKYYLSKENVLNEVVKNKENRFTDIQHLKNRLDVFCSELLQRSDTLKTPKDFAQHFRSWHKNKVKISSGNGVVKVGKKYKGII